MFNIKSRNTAKFVTRIPVYAASMAATEATLNTVVGPETEDAETHIHTGSVLIGAMIGYQLSMFTDKAVDRVADWRLRRKTEKNIANAVVES
jgi:hypothetical protein